VKHKLRLLSLDQRRRNEKENIGKHDLQHKTEEQGELQRDITLQQGWRT